MDPEKRRQLAELRKDRTKVIGKLREQLNKLDGSDNLKTFLRGFGFFARDASAT